MLTWLAPIIVVAVVSLAVTAKLLVRRRAPEGGWFTDLPRSAGSLSVIGTMFAVMLAFVILYSLQSFQHAREGAGIEAISVTELSAVAGTLPPPANDDLHGDLVCYGRAVVHDEWPAMRYGHSSELVESWIDKLYNDFSAIAAQGVATRGRVRTVVRRGVWSVVMVDARTARRGRAGIYPCPCGSRWGSERWPPSAYMVAQADKRESKVIQAIPIAFVSAIVTAGLLVVVFLDNPYSDRTAVSGRRR